MTVQKQPATRAVTVFCGSSSGNQPAFTHAATSLGNALANAQRRLIYGGGSIGIMGAVSGAVIDAGGDVTGITPMAMVAAGGEVDQRNGSRGAHVKLQETGREKVEYIVVNSMHERKAEMAKRSCAFVALPGGFGTFEEVLEVVCWTQIGLHSKPVLVLNVRGFYNPLRELVRNAIRDGFILERNEGLLRFVDGPEDLEEHASFDWGKAALETLDAWQSVQVTHYYNWKVRKEGEGEELDNA